MDRSSADRLEIIYRSLPLDDLVISRQVDLFYILYYLGRVFGWEPHTVCTDVEISAQHLVF